MTSESKITKEEISMTGFAIVAYAGDARTFLMQAMDKASIGKINEAKSLVKKAEESINLAHNEQTKLLSKEADGNELDVTFIMVHGQDTLMTTMLLKDEMKTIIDLYQRVNNLEGKPIE
ncbi:PTS lactose/cellobiose transporter subunit IIA [Lactobacillus sp. ESL0701]|uniref:PTS lactose/cellobiose transporter subunit IIA n=1 Tax=Lactobacillus sp. ESL0701 TaxID=2983217 RepID=UPI0023F993FA|nr:PTS lactose/cellobiose transporter subunit IIA [Lactobacillus sp. ESL0701]MDF7673019.1 PTS lactose/cellobiose transporter subunit IIA [Lactobacillus sp. ESL0701]